MSDLDFSSTSPHKPAASRRAAAAAVYNAAMAMEFFKSAGKPESFSAGATIFAEDEKGGLFKSPKMYVLILGEIEMIAQNKVIGSVKPGETFGEMAVIAQRRAPRLRARRASARSSAWMRSSSSRRCR
jgi:CRP-like cAMP-binding protein